MTKKQAYAIRKNNRIFQLDHGLSTTARHQMLLLDNTEEEGVANLHEQDKENYRVFTYNLSTPNVLGIALMPRNRALEALVAVELTLNLNIHNKQ